MSYPNTEGREGTLAAMLATNPGTASGAAPAADSLARAAAASAHDRIDDLHHRVTALESGHDGASHEETAGDDGK